MTRLTDSGFKPAHPQRWYIWGMPLSGKTSLGKKLRKLLPFPVFDLDAELEKHLGLSVTELFDTRGEEGFREAETERLHALADANDQFLMVVGGGTPCSYGNDEFMLQTGTCLFMDTPMDEIIRRSTAATADRPLLQHNPQTRLRELHRRRLPVYQRAHAEFFSEAEAIRFFTLIFQ